MLAPRTGALLLLWLCYSRGMLPLLSRPSLLPPQQQPLLPPPSFAFHPRLFLGAGVPSEQTLPLLCEGEAEVGFAGPAAFSLISVAVACDSRALVAHYVARHQPHSP